MCTWFATADKPKPGAGAFAKVTVVVVVVVVPQDCLATMRPYDLTVARIQRSGALEMTAVA